MAKSVSAAGLPLARCEGGAAGLGLGLLLPGVASVVPPPSPLASMVEDGLDRP